MAKKTVEEREEEQEVPVPEIPTAKRIPVGSHALMHYGDIDKLRFVDDTGTLYAMLDNHGGGKFILRRIEIGK